MPWLLSPPMLRIINSKGKGGRGGGSGSSGGGGGSGRGGGGSSGGGGAAVGLVAVGLELGVSVLGVAKSTAATSEPDPVSPAAHEWFLCGVSWGSCPYVIRTGDRAGQTCGRLHTQHRCFSRVENAWRAKFGDDVKLPCCADLLKSRIAIFELDFDAILSAMYALSTSVEGDCYRCVHPDPGIAAAAQGASESGTLPSTVPAEALHTFTLDSGASRCFFRDSTTLTPLPAPVPMRLAEPSGGPVVARSSIVLPCPAYHCPPGCDGHYHHSWGSACVDLHVHMDGTSPSHLTRRPGSSLYTLTTEPSQIAASAQVSALAQVAASCSCHLLSHQTLQWHHRLGHPSLPRLRGMHSHLLVSGLPRSLPPLPNSPAPPSLPCIEGRQRAAPRSSSFPPTTALLQTLHIDVWGPARVNGQSRERYFLLVVDDYTRYTTVFPLRSKGQVVDVLIPWIRTVCLQLRGRFGQDLPVLRLHSDRGGEFSSTLLRDFCHGEGILQSFTLLDSLQKNGIAERHMALSWRSLLNLWPRVSLPKTSPTLHWTGEVGDASVFRVWGSCTFVRDPSADKLSPCAIPCVFLGFVPDAPGWQFYHPTLRHVFPSQDVTFDKWFPYPLPPEGPAPSGIGTRGAEPEGVEPWVVASEGAKSGGAEPQGAALSGGSASASPRLSLQQLREWFVRRARLRSGATGAGGAGGTGVVAGAGDTGGAAATGPGGTRTRGTGADGTGGVEGAEVGDLTKSGATGADGAGAGGAGVGGTGAAGTGAVDPGAGGVGGTVRPRQYFVPLLQQVLGTPSSTGPTPPFLCPLPDQSQQPLQPASLLTAPSPYTEQCGSLTERREPASCPFSHVRIARRAPHLSPPPVPGTQAMTLHPSSIPLRVPLPAPPASSLLEVPDPVCDSTRAASPTVSRLLATAVTDPSFESNAASALIAQLLDFAATCRLDYATALVAESASASPPSIGGEYALGTDVLEDMQEDFECLAAAVPRFSSMLLALEGDPGAPDIPTPCSYAEAITGPYSSQWQAAMDVEMASWKSTGTYVDEVPPRGANIFDGMWIFRVKRPPGSPPAFKARYVARGFRLRHGVDYFQNFSRTPKMTTLRVLLHVGAERDYELHSLNFSIAFLQGSLHEEIRLSRPPGSLGRSLQRTTLAALGFAPSTADPSLFLRTDTSLPPFYVLVYVDDLVFATADTEALTLVKSR
ncbi:unnamed protein product [Closterium sp. NIES-54]